MSDLVLEPGELRHRVMLQHGEATSDEFNQPVFAWETYATRWAKVVAAASRDFWRADSSQPEQTHAVTLRGGGLARVIRASDRVVVATMSDLVLQIIGPPNDRDGRGAIIELACKEVERGA